jgi:hypothetical protein
MKNALHNAVIKEKDEEEDTITQQTQMLAHPEPGVKHEKPVVRLRGRDLLLLA